MTKIYNVRFAGDPEDHYFGSIAAIYEVFPPSVMGICKARLYLAKVSENAPYSNARVTVSVGVLHRKRTGRRRDGGPNKNMCAV